MKEIRYVRAITEALSEEMGRDKSVCIIGEDVGAGGGAFSATRGLLDEFGAKRVIDTPISETGFVGMSLGMAITGLRPVVEIMFMDFLTVCLDPIVNGMAKERYMFGGQFSAPVTIRTAAGAGGGAGPHHSQCLEAWVAHVPGLKVVMPSTPYDVKGLLKSSIRDDDPVIFIEHKYLYAAKGEIPEEEYLIPLGQAEVKREGDDVTVVATARMVQEALKAAEELAASGISVEVIDPRTIVPLDKETILTSVQKTGRLVVVHEAVRTGGIGAEIAAIVAEEAFDWLDAPVKRVGAAFSPVPFSQPMEHFCLPWAEDIIKAVREITG
ncbi:MAG: alpha-ketoacid dehydrogenase subunit beta [Chloroflexota bacterium]